MYGSTQPEDTGSAEEIAPVDGRPVAAGFERTNGSQTLAETELDAALQLLVERAQYITGATGSALAVPQGDEMVCRASAGSSAPAVGARLQVRSGLTGESIARRQLLRCDNAESDPRVNLEACRALGIASIVVLPLLRRDGQVRGLFELFSDHPYAFEERDLIALERMADLTLTALDLAEQRENRGGSATATRGTETPTIVSGAVINGPNNAGMKDAGTNNAGTNSAGTISAGTNSAGADVVQAANPVQILPAVERETVASVVPHPVTADPRIAELGAAKLATTSLEAVPALVANGEAPGAVDGIPAAMLRVQKCEACGFPVSEGRSLCLDCEKKEISKKDAEKKQRAAEPAPIPPPVVVLENQEEGRSADVPAEATATALPEGSAVSSSAEFVPAFLANAEPVQETWLSNHVNLLAIVVLILGILVAVVVFR